MNGQGQGQGGVRLREPRGFLRDPDNGRPTLPAFPDDPSKETKREGAKMAKGTKKAEVRPEVRWDHVEGKIMRLDCFLGDKLIAFSQPLACSEARELVDAANAAAKARRALKLWNVMEHRVANCDPDFHGEEMVPENCERCFPYCDAARLALREACEAFGIEVL